MQDKVKQLTAPLRASQGFDDAHNWVFVGVAIYVASQRTAAWLRVHVVPSWDSTLQHES